MSAKTTEPKTHKPHKITGKELKKLKQQGCEVENPDTLLVAEGFDPDHYRNVTFRGNVTLGLTDPDHGGGHIHNSLICNYVIGDGVTIENSRLEGSLDSSYGVGCKVNVLNESGGRCVPLHPELSSQAAYIIATYRHRPDVINRLTGLIAADAEALRGTAPTVACGAHITDCPHIKDVNIGPGAVLDNCSRLVNGTIVSLPEAPAFMGPGVVAENFITSTDSRVDSHAIIHNVLVGQGSELANGFTAHDSLFFANCTFHCGEAAAVFAGPFSVSMHKSTLLIGVITSFFNAGSGANQSNHAYKLGPRHQGILLRGCKLASNSYMSLPAVIGPFSTLMGDADTHPDTATLPFSYIFAQKGKTEVSAGSTLKSIGTARDAMKWDNRDRRNPNAPRLDVVNTAVLSPYTISLITKWLNRDIPQRGYTMPRASRPKAVDYYNRAISKFVGDSLIPILSRREITDPHDAETLLVANTAEYIDWLDIGGMLITHDRMEGILTDVEKGLFTSLNALNTTLHEAAGCYYADAALYASGLVNSHYHDITDPLDRLIKAITDAREALSLDYEALDDAMKEYSDEASRGYGIANALPAYCYIAVHGTADDDPTVNALRQDIARRTQLLDSILHNLNLLRTTPSPTDE